MEIGQEKDITPFAPLVGFPFFFHPAVGSKTLSSFQLVSCLPTARHLISVTPSLFFHMYTALLSLPPSFLLSLSAFLLPALLSCCSKDVCPSSLLLRFQTQPLDNDNKAPDTFPAANVKITPASRPLSKSIKLSGLSSTSGHVLIGD